MRNFLLFCAVLLFVSCTNSGTYVPEWVNTGKEINENYADVFLICGTFMENLNHGRPYVLDRVYR